MFSPTKELVDKWIVAVNATKEEYINETHESCYRSCKFCNLVTSPDAPENENIGIGGYVNCFNCIWAYMIVNNIAMGETYGVCNEKVIQCIAGLHFTKFYCAKVVYNTMDSYAYGHKKWLHVRRLDEWLDHLYELREKLNDK